VFGLYLVKLCVALTVLGDRGCWGSQERPILHPLHRFFMTSQSLALPTSISLVDKSTKSQSISTGKRIWRKACHPPRRSPTPPGAAWRRRRPAPASAARATSSSSAIPPGARLWFPMGDGGMYGSCQQVAGQEYGELFAPRGDVWVAKSNTNSMRSWSRHFV